MYPYQHPYSSKAPLYNYWGQPLYKAFPHEIENERCFDSYYPNACRNVLTDYGPHPYVANINGITKENNTFRTALWTGSNLQVTLMSLNVGEDIGLEVHPNVDQFLRIEQGQGIAKMGPSKDNLNLERNVYDDSAIIVPAGTWHNLINTGNIPLKLYSIYAPPNHPYGTVHVTKADALAEE